MGRRFGWVGWPEAWRWTWCDVVQIGSNKQHVFFMLWHFCVTTTRWHGDLADDVSFIHFNQNWPLTSALTKLSCLSTQDNQQESFAGMALYYIKAAPITRLWQATHNKMGRLKWGGGEKGSGGGGGGERKGASVHDHVGDGTWTTTHSCISMPSASFQSLVHSIWYHTVKWLVPVWLYVPRCVTKNLSIPMAIEWTLIYD